MGELGVRSWIGLIAGLMVAIALPNVLTGYGITLANEVIVFGIFAIGINILLGYTGFVSVGHAMFMGFGGYALAILVELLGLPVWQSMILSIIALAVVSLLIGLICMRVSRIQFLVITLAIAEMFFGLFNKLRVTGGDDGMVPTDTFRPDLTFLGLDVSSGTGFYYYALGCLVVVMLLVYRFLRSPFGSVLVGIRENEKRMISLGYNVPFYKNIAFMVSGMVSGFAGILFCQQLNFINPENLSWQISGEGLLMVIMGGRQFFVGPLVGAGFYVVAKAMLSDITEDYILIFGLLFMVIVALFPRGLTGTIADLFSRRRKNPPAPSDPPEPVAPSRARAEGAAE